VTQSYIQYVIVLVVLIAVDEFLLATNVVVKALRVLLPVLWSLLLTSSWTLTLDPLGRAFIMVTNRRPQSSVTSL